MKILFYLLINSIILGSNIIIKVEIKKNEYIYYENISIKYKIINNSDINYFYPDARAYIIDEEGKEEIFGSYLKRLRRMPLFIKGREIKNGGIGGIMTKSGRYRIYVMINGEKAKDDNSYLKFKEKFKDQNFDILTEKIKSNEVEIEVKEPEGIDKEVYERYLKVDEMRWKAYNSENPIFWELLEKYPSSRYSGRLAVEKFVGCGLAKNCRISSKKEAYKSCKSLMKRGSTYYNKEPISKEGKEAKNRKERTIKVLEEIIKEHSDSIYKNYLLHRLSYEILHYGDYKKAKYYFEQILDLDPKIDQNKELIEEAREIIRCINEEEK